MRVLRRAGAPIAGPPSSGARQGVRLSSVLGLGVAPDVPPVALRPPTGTAQTQPKESHGSFATDVRPLFRDKDVQSMKSIFDLSRYQDVKDNADGILETVANGSMPCDQTWSSEQLATLRARISEGLPE